MLLLAQVFHLAFLEEIEFWRNCGISTRLPLTDPTRVTGTYGVNAYDPDLHFL